MSVRKIKGQTLELLRQADFDAGLAALRELPARQVINPLFGLLCHADELVRWHAVSAMGVVTAHLADRELEGARVIMRRLMWNLNDESGGIGWGSPEAMGEIMACHDTLAREYAAILISYLNPEGNYLEHEGLQQGVLWGFGRLARSRPSLALPGIIFLKPFLSSPVAALRGLAAWAAAALIDSELRELLLPLCVDPAPFTLYEERRLRQVPVAEMARAAMGQQANLF